MLSGSGGHIRLCIAAVVEAGKAALVCGNAAFGALCEEDDDV